MKSKCWQSLEEQNIMDGNKKIISQNLKPLNFNFLLIKLLLISFFLSIPNLVFTEQSTNNFLRVTFLDVGQGDAILIRTHQKTILLDAGDDRLNAGTSVITPYLKREGIKKIDSCIISHPHRDHFGGLIDILQNFEIGEVLYSSDVFGDNTPEESPNDALLYMKIYNLIKEKNIPYLKLKTGTILNWGNNIKVEVLHAADIEGEPLNFNIQPIIVTRSTNLPNVKSSANNKSLVIKASLGKISYLFTGDIEKEGEEKLIDRFSNKLTCTVLKVAHHGSKSSTTNAFLELTKPEYAIISVGAKNIFSHPNKEILEKLKYYKAKIFRTDQDGTIDTKTTGNDISIVSNNQSDLVFTQPPKVLSVSANTATIQWETNKNSNTIIYWGENSFQNEKIIDQYVKKHTVTITNLKPNTKYQYKVVSLDEKIPNQYVTAEGTIQTLAGNAEQLPIISYFGSQNIKAYLKSNLVLNLSINNPTNTYFTNASVKVYQYSISDDNLLTTQEINIKPNSTFEGKYNINLTTEGDIDIIAVLYINSNIADTASIKIKVEPKIAIVDCAHGNIEYYKGIFSGMKMDLYNNLGILLKSASKEITDETLKDAFLFISSDPQNRFTSNEIYSLSNFLANGGALMLFMKSDYNNLSNPEYYNEILAAIGSKIRFNDDQFCDPTNNIGPPWRPFVRVFPSPIIENVDKLLFRSACTLVSNTNGPLYPSKYVHIVAAGDEDSYNVDVDNQNDCSYYYASSSQKISIPVIAVEQLPAGKIACYGEKLYDHKLYADNRIPTALFNRQVISWLLQKNQPNLDQLLSTLDELEFLNALEYQINYLDSLSSKILTDINQNLFNDQQPHNDKIFSKFDKSSNGFIRKLKKDLLLIQKFKILHKE